MTNQTNPTRRHYAPKTLVTGPVLDYMESHRGQSVTLSAIVAATGLSEKQVQNSLSMLRRQHHMPITTIVRGRCWKFELPVDPSPETKAGAWSALQTAPVGIPAPVPTPVPNGQMIAPLPMVVEYTEVGKSKDGLPIVRDVQGRLYKLAKI